MKRCPTCGRPTPDQDFITARGILTAAMAAKELGCTTRHIRRLCLEQALVAQPFGAGWAIDRESFDAYKSHFSQHRLERQP